MPNYWIPKRTTWAQKIGEEEDRLRNLQYGEGGWEDITDEEVGEKEPWWPKAVETAFTPFTMYGAAHKENIRRITEAFRDPRAAMQRPVEWQPLERLREIAPSGRLYEEAREAGWEQLPYELPLWMTIPSAMGLRTALAPAAARPGMGAIAPKVARAALFPVEWGIERPIATGLKYFIGLPLKYGVAKPIELGTRKSFETALDRGLDKWLMRQGIRGDQANSVIRFFLEKNNRWLYQKAEANWLKRLAEKKGTKYASSKAAADTITEAEPLLLESARGAGIPTKVKPEVPTVKPVAEAMATNTQKVEAHRIAYTKALISEKGKMKPQYRRLAKAMTGKRSMLEMTETEADTFMEALKRLPEPTIRGREKIPPRIPTITKVVPENYFNLKFREPTPIKAFTSQIHYAQVLGVKPLVEPLELAKQRLDLEFQALGNAVDIKINEINRAWGISAGEKLKAKVKNIPTRAVKELRDLLDKYESPPVDLPTNQAELFIWFRNLGRTILNGENQVRRLLGIEEIPYRQAYVRHIADATAQEIMLGNRPIPEALKYWSQRIVGKRIFNPMEMQRNLATDLEEYFTKDLAYATKSMLWTGLKEIHLSQPLQALSEQMGAFTRDLPEYKGLPAIEFERMRQLSVLPASTRRWVTDYVNQVIKGQQTLFDEEINRIVTQSGLGGLLDKALKPFGRTLGPRPVTRLSQLAGRAMMISVMGLPRPRLLRLMIRNLFQHTQDLALCDITSCLKGYFPAKGNLAKLIDRSLFIKGYTGFEELPTGIQGKLEKLALRPYGATAVFNANTAMKTAYWDYLPYIGDPKYRDLGWADPQRTYTEAKDFLYPSEEALLLKEMEWEAGATQYQYIGLGMPQIFRHKTLIPFTRLQSWWMNHFFRFHREAIHRTLTGTTGTGQKLPWRKRLNYLQYLILGGAVLTSMGYSMSYLWKVLPYNLTPVAQFVMGLYGYVAADTDWQRANAKRQIFNSWKAIVPGALAWEEFEEIWSGERPIWSIFFYGAEEEGPPPRPPTWGITPPVEKGAPPGLPRVPKWTPIK